MFKKIVLGFLLFFLIVINSFAVCEYCQTYCGKENRVPASLFLGTGDNKAIKNTIASKYHQNNKIICDAETDNSTGGDLDKYGLCSSESCLGNLKKIEDAMKEIQKMYDQADERNMKQRELAESKRLSKLNGAEDLSSKEFEVTTSKLLGDNKLKQEKASETINMTLGTIIQKLMIGLGSISLLIMTIGAGYMIMYSGHDELLSKGKSIFNAGIIALVVSLLSYYLVSLLRFILYK